MTAATLYISRRESLNSEERARTRSRMERDPHAQNIVSVAKLTKFVFVRRIPEIDLDTFDEGALCSLLHDDVYEDPDLGAGEYSLTWQAAGRKGFQPAGMVKIAEDGTIFRKGQGQKDWKEL